MTGTADLLDVVWCVCVYCVSMVCTPPTICSVYERAVQSCGLDYRSAKIWDAYIDWESGSGRQRKVMALYDRLLNIPTKESQTHFEKWVTFSLSPSLPPPLLHPAISPSCYLSILLSLLPFPSTFILPFPLFPLSRFKKLLESTPTSHLLLEEEYKDISSEAGDVTQGEVRPSPCHYHQ